MLNKMDKNELKRLVKELEKYRGRHTELISVYVPEGGNINVVREQLFQEQGTASNIKSKTTRKNVQAALEKASGELRQFTKTPPNGLVVFAGNISEKEGQLDLRSWTVEPPDKLNVRMYRCAQTFVLDPLREMLEAKYVYGLIAMDDKDAVFGLLKGKSIMLLKELRSAVPGKQRQGGQSAVRFMNVRKELQREWYKTLGKMTRALFEKYKNLKGVILGGPGPAKESFYSSDYLSEYKNKIMGIKDIPNCNDLNALKELVVKAQDLLEKEEILEEKKLMDEFLGNLGKDNGLSVYGKINVEKALESGAVDRLLLSEGLKDEELDELKDKAELFSTNVIIISTDTDEGKQLLELGGFAAILRYKLTY